jgi:hypothetical protein
MGGREGGGREGGSDRERARAGRKKDIDDNVYICLRAVFLVLVMC